MSTQATAQVELQKGLLVSIGGGGTLRKIGVATFPWIANDVNDCHQGVAWYVYGSVTVCLEQCTFAFLIRLCDCSGRCWTSGATFL